MPQTRTDYLLNPSAPSASPCALRITADADQVPMPITASLPPATDPTLVAVISLMEATGARISEVLNIRPTDVTSKGVILIRGLKGSNSRNVFPGTWSPWFIKHRLSLPLIDMGFNRWYFYREFKKLGISARFGNNTCNSVTHYFRHALAADMHSNNFQLADTARALGHKKIENANRYGRNTQK